MTRGFISGIYNYCDRWCERCEFTSRCLNAAMQEEEEARDPASRDIQNKAFWDRLHGIFQQTIEMIREDAGEQGIDRSIEAWSVLRRYLPTQADCILSIMVHLERLRKRIQAAFPNARAFVRAGFDGSIPLPSPTQKPLDRFGLAGII